MKNDELYLDTNIFIYLSDKTSIYFKECSDLINYCHKNKILISTSTETIQEIIHYSKNTKQLKEGLIVAKKVLKLIDNIYSITKISVEIYLENAEVYTNVKSRDLIHLSVCQENKIDKIITYDKEFKQFKKLKALGPSEIIVQAS